MVASYSPQDGLDVLKSRSKEIQKHTPIASKEGLEANESEERTAAIEVIEAAKTRHETKDLSRIEKTRKNIETLYKARERTFGYKLQELEDYNQDEIDAIIEDLKSHYDIQTEKQDISSKAEFNPYIPQAPQPASNPAETAAPKPQEPQANSPTGKTNPDTAPKPSEKKQYTDVHLGRAFIDMQNRAYEINEVRIKKMIDDLTHLNATNKDLSDLITIFTRHKEKGKADFTGDPETRSLIDRIHKVNPKIFGGGNASDKKSDSALPGLAPEVKDPQIYVFDNEKQIDIVLAGLDAEVKAKIAEVNQATMMINLRFDERIQYTENARKVLEMLIRHVESIISKYHKT
jgi:hypothetical protein